MLKANFLIKEQQTTVCIQGPMEDFLDFLDKLLEEGEIVINSNNLKIIMSLKPPLP